MFALLIQENRRGRVLRCQKQKMPSLAAQPAARPPSHLLKTARTSFVKSPFAQKMQTLVPKDSTNPDQIVGMDSIVAEAVATKFLSAPLTKEQVSELVQMKNPPKP
jgi:hypothetical protein